MNELKIEIRKYIAQKLIQMVLWVLPDCNFKENLTRFLMNNFKYL